MAYSTSDIILTATLIPALPFTDYETDLASIVHSKPR